MPPRADYHMHSQFSCDARDTMENMCRAAIEIGLDEVAVTDHFDPHPLDSCPGFYRPEAYFAELTRCRELFADKLTIRAGIEIGDAHRFAEEVRAIVGTWPYDFAIGSVHWVGDEAPFGREFFLRHDADWAYRGYFDEMAGKARADDFDVIGHIDLIKREGTEFYGRFDAEMFGDELRAILRTLIERGRGIEINTSGWRRSAGEPCPALPVLRWYAELGGEILTIGSDSHRTPHVGLFWDEAIALAREAGLRWLTTFDRRKPIQHPLET
jgi:histidinol-phosphatase (PHP family)